MALAEGMWFDAHLMHLMRGDDLPDHSVPVGTWLAQ